MRHLKPLTLLFPVLLACAGSGNEAGGDPDPLTGNEEVRVVVRNNATWDATIYVLRSGSIRTRVGTARSLSTTTLTLPRNVVSGLTEVRFVVDWIGRPRDSASQRIVAQPGDVIELDIR